MLDTLASHEVTSILGDLVALPSINPERLGPLARAPYGEEQIALYVQRHFERLGLAVERQPVHPGRDNVIVRAPGSDPAAAPLLLEAHMDTVGVEGMADPFTPRIQEGRLHGRGSCDTKASLAAMMLALQRVAARPARLRHPVWLVAAADEEYGQTGIRRLMSSGIQPAAAVVGEPTALQVIAAHKGQVYLRLHTRGKAAHTSVPERGHNAILDMARVIELLAGRVARHYPPRAHALCGPPLLSISVIEGGVSEHIVPEHCQISIDLRTVPGQQTAAALAELRGWIDQGLPGLAGRVSLEAPHQDAPPMETPVDHPLVRSLERAVRGRLGEATVTGVPYNTDAGALAAAGVPVVVFGPGDIAQAHTTTEFVELEQVVAAAEILEQLLLELGS